MGTTSPRQRVSGMQPHLFLKSLRHLEAVVASVDGECWVAGHAGASILGLDGFPLKAPFDLVVPLERRLHRGEHRIHRLRSLTRLDTTTAMGLPCLSATRLLIELAPSETPKRLTAALDSALRDGLTSEDFLHRRMVELRSRGRSGLDRLLGVVAGSELSRGGHSFLEREFLEVLGGLGLPRPLAQQVVARRAKKLVRVDFRFPDTNVIIEVLGYEWHRSPMQMQADAERLNRLQLDGFLAMQFTYVDVVTRSPTMTASLLEALSNA